MQRVIWPLLSFALVIFVILDQELFSEFSTNEETNDSSEIVIVANCGLSRVPCTVELPGGSIIEITSSRDVVKALEPINIQVSIKSVSTAPDLSLPKGLSLHFAGREMEMGAHYLIPQSPINEGGKQQDFQGMIPVCSVDPKMAWNLILKFQLNNNTFIVSTSIKTSVQH